jgi:hypothetical protein
MAFPSQGNPILSLIGDVIPNETASGEIVTLTNSKSVSSVLDSLKRPVYTHSVDLDNDSRNDLIVCAAGNYTGALLVFHAQADGTYEQHVLSPLPGARKVVVQDVDENGLADILALMTNGDERIVLYSNYGNFTFKQTTLLRFPPVYGSSDFEMKDLDLDGHLDILYCNGDNADFSPILKPYHGIRLFRNDGKNNFKESWFYSLHGASQVHANDFDQDGDQDFAVIAYFPDYKREPERGFVYFENKEGKFQAQITPLAIEGRWITMETADVDQDGDRDIVLGAASLNSDGVIPPDIFTQWQTKKTTLLYLENALRK